jgi:hypothetical protein
MNAAPGRCSGRPQPNPSLAESPRDIRKRATAGSSRGSSRRNRLKLGLCPSSLGLSPILPVTVQFLVAMFAYGLNERMARKAEYLREDDRVLKEALRAATGKSRIPLTDEQRRRLATKGKALTPAEREPGLVPAARRSQKCALDISPSRGPKFRESATPRQGRGRGLR